MRKAFLDYEEGRAVVVSSEHVYHCLDSLRQDISCYADDTPMPGPFQGAGIGNAQTMQCRNLTKVFEWATTPERGACFHAGNDFRHVLHNLERHAFCPENSQYSPVVKEYFEKHGHKDIYVGDEETAGFGR
jgi:hypothetical protein